MKRTFTLITAAMLALVGCQENIIDESTHYETSIEAYANLNPEEPIILSVSNEEGESVVLMGAKSATGHPETLQSMIITLPEKESPTEIYFNENEQIQEIITPDGVRFQFDWLSETKAALTLIDPTTNEQLNTMFDLEDPMFDIPSEDTKTFDTPREGSSSLVIEPIYSQSTQQTSLETRSSGELVGTVYVEFCGVPEDNATCWVVVHDYTDMTGSWGKGKFRGRFPCTPIGNGYYQYKLPANYHEHHDLADYCDSMNKIMSIVCGLNAWTAPSSGAKQYVCIAVSTALMGGVISAPVAALFGEACLWISTAIDASCTMLSGDLPEGAPSLSDGLCGMLHEMNYTWDTPLYMYPVVNALPSNAIGSLQIHDANTPLENMVVKMGGKPKIESFKLSPSAPMHGVSYIAIAELACLPPGTQVVMDIVGTDGYEDTKTSFISSDESVRYKATLSVPGAASGVKDVCTVKVITPKGETLTKKASLRFQ
jgi:hypothetical protein